MDEANLGFAEYQDHLELNKSWGANEIPNGERLKHKTFKMTYWGEI